MKKHITFLFLALSSGASAQKLDTLTVEKIMRDPKWIGVSPSAVHWTDDSKKIYFKWNPENTGRDQLYSTTPSGIKPVKVTADEQRSIVPQNGDWNKKHTLKVFEKNGDLWLYDLKNGSTRQLTSTTDIESDPSFSSDESRVIFHKEDNLFVLNLNGSGLVQLTNFVKTASTQPSGKRSAKKNTDAIADNEQERWLKAEQLELFDIIKVRDRDRKLDSVERKDQGIKKLTEIVFGDRSVGDVKVSPDLRYVTYRLTKSAEGMKNVIVPNYVTASGFTEDIPNRTKVGAPQDTYESYVFDKQRDTIYSLNTKTIPGIKDIPAYIKEYPKEFEQFTKANADRKVEIRGPYWSEDAKQAVVAVDANDFKDRWIMKLDPMTGNLSLLDREHNDAWVGGPGFYALGWIDNTHIYFQGEATGHSHIYVSDVLTGVKKQITNGNWEVQTLQLSNDKKTFYFTANKEHPGVSDLYRIPVLGGEPVRITSLKGGNDVTLSPDERSLAILYSYSNKPWELYVQANRPGAKPVKVTNSTTGEFNSYAWRDPQVITFKNRYGSDVYARLYLPKVADPAKPAVVFVHGAGYLQNADYKWSHYFREYMFNNMLADNGYTVLDMDYSGSAGYGRDWRTAIYRHMGGKDLTDQVDGVKMLVEKYGVNPKHVGLYGGSYGGFITLMAMFTEQDTFLSGGAIRSVTDWAHYNHGYTAEILNEPFTDEKSYRQSSPIYFANGLKGSLLMLHGMIDQNVNYQDIIRLTQRLIELHKENWELASYPVEDHGFEQPSSWTDEYKRIYKLFEQTLKK